MAKVSIPEDLVVFQDSQGNLISNDPRFQALKTLGIDPTQGVSFAQSQPEVAAERTAKASGVTEAPKKSSSKAAAEVVAEEVDDEGNRTYRELKGKDLGSFAKKRGVEIKGLEAKEVRAALVAQDAESDEEDAEEDDDEIEDDEEESEESEDDESEDDDDDAEE